jgi:colanic acid biosynthesis glycosyl transferase WcaI
LRVLVITQYFYPEKIRIHDVCLGLKERGHDVTVLTGKPNYPNGEYYMGYSWFNRKYEVWNGIKVYRSNLILRGRAGKLRLVFNYLSFVFLASFNLFRIRTKFDKIFIFAPSPLTVGIVGILARMKFKAKAFLWVHDLWPESIKIAGGITNKKILNVVGKITKWIYSNVDILMVQSQGFIPYIINQGVEREKIIYYPFYAEAFYKVEKSEDKYFKKLPKGFKIMFAGNIGVAQSFDTLLNAAIKLKKQKLPIVWLIFGMGRMFEYVRNEIQKNDLQDTFILMGYIPPEKIPKYSSCADALILSLKKSPVFSITIPGKLQSYLACGRPIIGSIDGIGADIINDSGAGFTASAESVDDLVNAIINLHETPLEEQRLMGASARAYFEREFEREMLIDKLELILSK